MNFRRWNSVVWLALLAAGAMSACRKVYVVVPRPSGGYKPDTLRATLNGNDARVIFRFDTVTRTRTVYITDTLWREGKQIIHDTVRLVRRDTIRVVRRDTVRLTRVDTVRLNNVLGLSRDTVRITRRDTVRILRVDTVRLAGPARVDTVRVSTQAGVIIQVDTVRLRDTVYIQQPVMQQGQRRVDTIRVYRTDTLRLTRTDTVRSSRVDTLRLVRHDTVRVTRVDTLRLTRVDTVRVTVAASPNGGRKLFVPPGHYPPEGQCRVWVDGTPPGRQRDPAPCDKLGDIPAGAFVLYGGVAWDFDFNWAAAGDGSAPPPIIALKRK